MSLVALALMGAAITVVPTGPYEPRQAIVKYDDLNLSKIADREILDQRLDRAVRVVCGSSNGEPLYMKMAARRCVTRTTRQVAPQRDLAVAQSGAKFASGN